MDLELPRIIKCLYQLTKDNDAKTASNAFGLLVSILDAQFIMGIAFLKIILPIKSSLNTFIQKPSIGIRKVRVAAEGTIKTLEGCRTENDYDLIWKSFEHNCNQFKAFVFEEKIDFHFKEIKLPRNLPEDVSDIKGYLRITTNFPSLDRVVSDLKRQFAENDKDNLCSLFAIIFDNDPENSHIKKVANFYSLDTELLCNNVRLFKHFQVNSYFILNISILF